MELGWNYSFSEGLMRIFLLNITMLSYNKLCSWRYCFLTQNLLLLPPSSTFLINRTLIVFYWLQLHALLSQDTVTPGQSQGQIKLVKMSPYLKGNQWKRYSLHPVNIPGLTLIWRNIWATLLSMWEREQTKDDRMEMGNEPGFLKTYRSIWINQPWRPV